MASKPRPRTKTKRGGIFISYRRDEAAGEAGRLADHLARWFGDEAVFIDVKSIVGGDDWRQRLETALDDCDTMLVVVGRNWLQQRDPTNSKRRRLRDPQDMVAWEVERGLSRGLQVIAVRVQDAAPLKAEDLPPRIAALSMWQSVVLSHETFVADAGQLASHIRRARRAARTVAGGWSASDLSRWATAYDSGPEGTCAAIAIVNALELLMKRSGSPRALSVRYLYEKAQRHQQAKPGEEGLFMLPALFAASFFGVPDESVWPYRPGKRSLPRGTTWAKLDAHPGPLVRGEFFRVDGVLDAIRQLAAGRPVLASCNIKRSTWDSAVTQRSGELSMPAANAAVEGMHAVLLVGFEPRRRRFTFVNSWGSRWGKKGFGWMDLDVARATLVPGELWSVELSRETILEISRS